MTDRISQLPNLDLNALAYLSKATEIKKKIFFKLFLGGTEAAVTTVETDSIKPPTILLLLQVGTLQVQVKTLQVQVGTTLATRLPPYWI